MRSSKDAIEKRHVMFHYGTKRSAKFHSKNPSRAFRPLTMRPSRRVETSGTNYPVTQRHMPGERRYSTALSSTSHYASRTTLIFTTLLQDEPLWLSRYTDLSMGWAFESRQEIHLFFKACWGPPSLLFNGHRVQFRR